MDFVKSHFGKMQLWIVEHFHLHKKVPVVINHNIQFFQMLWFITTGTFLWRWNYSELHFAEVTFYKIHTLEKNLLVHFYKRLQKVNHQKKFTWLLLSQFTVPLVQKTWPDLKLEGDHRVFLTKTLRYTLEFELTQQFVRIAALIIN